MDNSWTGLVGVQSLSELQLCGHRGGRETMRETWEMREMWEAETSGREAGTDSELGGSPSLFRCHILPYIPLERGEAVRKETSSVGVVSTCP